MTSPRLQRALVRLPGCSYCGAPSLIAPTCVAHNDLPGVDASVSEEAWPRAEWLWDRVDFEPAPALVDALMEAVG